MRMAGLVTFVVIGALGALAVGEVVAEGADVPAVSEVSMFTAPASGDTYQFGDPIEVRVDFDRLVTVTGTPQINLTVGSTTRAVGLTGPAFQFRSRISSLLFEYHVVAADSDARWRPARRRWPVRCPARLAEFRQTAACSFVQHRHALMRSQPDAPAQTRLTGQS